MHERGLQVLLQEGRFAGQLVGLREVDDWIWLVSFLDFALGFFDHQEDRVEPAPNPFVPVQV